MGNIQFSMADEVRRMTEARGEPFLEPGKVGYFSGPSHGSDWHALRHEGEPECGRWEWRTSNRMVVLSIRSMDDTLLAHVARFAFDKLQHASKMGVLMEERSTRMSIHGLDPASLSYRLPQTSV